MSQTDVSYPRRQTYTRPGDDQALARMITELQLSNAADIRISTEYVKVYWQKPLDQADFEMKEPCHGCGRYSYLHELYDHVEQVDGEKKFYHVCKECKPDQV